ncbi:hypothetical protein AT2G02635 [Arabidopsis thaliana]|uniref:Uncharacterized protein n=1 Tax=Arabidopsis thaliana TaxID=3702 RepID=A0A1P8AXV5_ARATH|nr:uncharacterized protein AT2G02635 [Arabidopsis thaliana]ANM61475.1 hypothetical protein AT2G02635 [Arabidopsis thaliana]|eukprot:NP_001323692.1 hypothetical protein AT2G02635 [Arabidopsis thaliana]
MGESIDENQNVHMSRQPSRVYLLQTAAKEHIMIATSIPNHEPQKYLDGRKEDIYLNIYC